MCKGGSVDVDRGVVCVIGVVFFFHMSASSNS